LLSVPSGELTQGLMPSRRLSSRLMLMYLSQSVQCRPTDVEQQIVETLREFRKAQLEMRVKLGAGKLPDDALLFAGLDGAPPSQKRYSKAWSDFADQIKMPDLGFHNLRHTHASELIDAGVDIVTISKRLGHAKPDITLRIYAHLFQKDDGKAAAAINAALNR